jgi:hypothetical protein
MGLPKKYRSQHIVEGIRDNRRSFRCPFPFTSFKVRAGVRMTTSKVENAERIN